MASRSLLIGTRGSPLALWQAGHVRALLIAAHGLGDDAVALSAITTSGDRIRDSRCAISAARASSPRRSTKPCLGVRSISPCIR